MKKQIYTLIIAFLFLLPSLLAQGLFDTKGFAKASKDKNVKVISVQSAKNYRVSHLRNAIHIDQTKLHNEGKPEGVLKPADDIAQFLGENGISNTNTIIVYDDGDNKAAGRMYWTLKYLGVADVKILQKDMKAWRAARIPLTPAPTKITEATFAANPDTKIFVDTKWVKANLKTANVLFVDARAPNEFTGDDGKSPGHIPGAINLEWKSFGVNGGVLKSNEEMAKMLKSAGITPDKTIVLYCGTAVRAGLPFFVMSSLLDYPNVKIYDGAMNVWTTDASNPVE
ncbi:MAG: sulfurtransferase [Bacteroidales bacterium]|jgi:thiosulfate/3-mercaptopyruvate sulfurtransferase|nr:sulfurtransferase [Bacteroidales bacterium]